MATGVQDAAILAFAVVATSCAPNMFDVDMQLLYQDVELLIGGQGRAADTVAQIVVDFAENPGAMASTP